MCWICLRCFSHTLYEQFITWQSEPLQWVTVVGSDQRGNAQKKKLQNVSNGSMFITNRSFFLCLQSPAKDWWLLLVLMNLDDTQSFRFQISPWVFLFYFTIWGYSKTLSKQYFALTWSMLETLAYEKFYYVCNCSFKIKPHFIYCFAFFYVSGKYGGEYCLWQLNCFCYLSQQPRQDENPFMHKIPLQRVIERRLRTWKKAHVPP